MLLLSKVRFWDIFREICEAVWGRAPLIGSNRSGTLWHRSLSQSGEHGLTRPLTFGLTRPLIASASHNLSCDLSEPIREHGLSRTRPPTASQIWESDRPLTHSGAIWLISRLNALLRPVESDRPLTHSGRESDPRGYLTDFTAKRIASPGRVRSDSHGLTDRPHRFESPICEADLWGCERPWEAEHGLSDYKVMWSVWESEVRGRIDRSDSHGLPYGLSIRPLTSDSHGLPHGLTVHRSDSLTDLTMWQIWQIDFIAI